MDNNLSEQILKTINTLFVSSDLETKNLIEKKCSNIFASFSGVLTAEEGLALFKNSHFELVVTDYYLPGINGLEFLRQLKMIDPKIPVIMLSDYMDMQSLVSALNMDIAGFVPKPIQLNLFRNAVKGAVERVVIDNLERKARAQELEILQYRENNNLMNHELAFRKELKIIRNDLFMEYYNPNSQTFSPNGWNFTVSYESKDQLSGDSYACRKLADGSVLVFIADAMGKGISASLTSISAVSLVNFMINESIKMSRFDFHAVISNYTSFVKDNLLEEEVMCSVFIHLDFANDKMYYASFAMPRIALGYGDGSVKKVISNNLPIMNFITEINITEIDIENITRILVFSDGLVESRTKDGLVYSPYLRGDFIASPFLNILEKRVQRLVEDFEDDTTMIFINKPFAGLHYESFFALDTLYADLPKSQTMLESEMVKNGINPHGYESFFTAFSEAVMNAYEHGNLNIDLYEKQTLIEKEEYEPALLELEKNCDKKITIRFTICVHLAYKYMIIGVRDDGCGYPVDYFKRGTDGSVKFCGRGVKIISYYTDSVFFSHDRREIFLAKILKKDI